MPDRPTPILWRTRHSESVTQPPIIPGNAEPAAPSSVLPPNPPKKTRWWLAPAIYGAATVLVLAAGAIYFLGRPQTPVVSSPATPPVTPLRAAYTACGEAGYLSGSDRTLFLQDEGAEPGISSILCVLNVLHAPSDVTTLIRHALDGQVSETWSTFKATWTYRPDHGLDVLIHDMSES